MSLAHAVASVLAADSPQVRLRLLHVDHALFEDSADWLDDCAAFAESLRSTHALVEFQGLRVEVDLNQGLGLEGSARQARYAALLRLLNFDQADASLSPPLLLPLLPPSLPPLLLLAHQQNDQAETVMLRVLRGGGTRGIAAMRPLSERVDAKGRIALIGRPWLSVARADIEAYATQAGITWREDTLNQRMQSPRNWLRHSVLPQMRQRFPALNGTLCTLAAQAATDRQLIEDLAQAALAQCLGLDGTVLLLQPFEQLQPNLQLEVLRLWLRCELAPSLGDDMLDLPAGFLTQLHGLALADKGELKRGQRCVFRRDQSRLYAGIDRSALVVEVQSFQCVWDGKQALRLPTGDVLRWHSSDSSLEPLRLQVDFQNQGRMRLSNSETASPKEARELFAQAQIPPWERPLWPRLRWRLDDRFGFQFDTFDGLPGLFLSQRLSAQMRLLSLRLQFERQSGQGTSLSAN